MPCVIAPYGKAEMRKVIPPVKLPSPATRNGYSVRSDEGSYDPTDHGGPLPTGCHGIVTLDGSDTGHGDWITDVERGKGPIDRPYNGYCIDSIDGSIWIWERGVIVARIGADDDPAPLVESIDRWKREKQARYDRKRNGKKIAQKQHRTRVLSSREIAAAVASMVENGEATKV